MRLIVSTWFILRNFVLGSRATPEGAPINVNEVFFRYSLGPQYRLALFFVVGDGVVFWSSVSAD